MHTACTSGDYTHKDMVMSRRTPITRVFCDWHVLRNKLAMMSVHLNWELVTFLLLNTIINFTETTGHMFPGGDQIPALLRWFITCYATMHNIISSAWWYHAVFPTLVTRICQRSFGTAKTINSDPTELNTWQLVCDLLCLNITCNFSCVICMITHKTSIWC